MRPDKLIVTRTTTHKQITTQQVNVKAVVQKGFNEPSDTIEIETISGLAVVKKRENAFLSITFQNGNQWSGTFRDLQSILKPIQPRYAGTKVYIVKGKTKFEVFDLMTKSRWANEFFKTVEDAITFCDGNGFEIVKDPTDISNQEIKIDLQLTLDCNIHLSQKEIESRVTKALSFNSNVMGTMAVDIHEFREEAEIYGEEDAN